MYGPDGFNLSRYQGYNSKQFKKVLVEHWFFCRNVCNIGMLSLFLFSVRDGQHLNIIPSNCFSDSAVLFFCLILDSFCIFVFSP